MKREITKERILKLNIKDLKEGDTLLFCRDCDYQQANVAKVPTCPKCSSHLYLIDITNQTLNEIQFIQTIGKVGVKNG